MSIYERVRDEKQIVAFCGKKRSGKDTAAEAIEDHGYQPIAFADPIKQTCRFVFQFDDEQIDGARKAEKDEFWDFTPRWAMQTIGTELFRDGIDEDVWVKSLLARVDASDKKRFAVTDVRFPNEVEHLQRAGADLVYIRRPKKEPDLNPTKWWIAKQGGVIKKVASFFTEFESEYHASEISLDDHSVTNTPDVVNDATIEQFRVAVRDRVRQLHQGGDFLPPDAPYRASQVKTQ